MDRIKRFQAGVAKASLAASAVVMGTVALAIFASVFCRFVLKIGLMWVDQYARYMLIWAVFLASNVLIYRNDLMRVDFLDSRWPEKFKKVREGFYTIIFIIMLLVLFWQGLQQAIAYIGVQLMGIKVDKFWVYLSIPVGAFLMLLQYVLNLIVMFFEKNENQQDAVIQNRDTVEGGETK